MWKHRIGALALLLVGFSLSTARAQDSQVPEPPPSGSSTAKLMDVQLVLGYEFDQRSTANAISGETTGMIIETKRGTFEPDFGKNDVFRLKADRPNGKMVQAIGSLEIRKDVTMEERRIIHVTKLKEVNDK